MLINISLTKLIIFSASAVSLGLAASRVPDIKALINKNFEFDEYLLLENKGAAIFKLNSLLSEKIVPTCSSCGKQLEQDTKFAICEECYKKRVRFRPRGSRNLRGSSSHNKENSPSRKNEKKTYFKRRKKKR